MNGDLLPQQPQQEQVSYGIPGSFYASQEGSISNIVGQIDPSTIIDNLDHALKGEQWNKEKQQWIMNATGEPLVNEACRAAVISYLDGILTNNTSMAHLDKVRLSFLMESVISSIKRMFVCNLEKFGFVEPGPDYLNKIYYNRGSPDSARMTMVANMCFKVAFLVFTRALDGKESMRIFKSLAMHDPMSYGQPPEPSKKGWLGKIFGK